MAEVLASLKKIGGNGEQYTETSLWTNPDPTSNFAGQNVTLSDNIGDYKYMKITWKTTTSDTAYSSAYVLVSDLASMTATNGSRFMSISCMSTNVYKRNVTYNSATSIGISTSYRENASGSNNGVNIPLEILGINELAHQTVVGNYDTCAWTQFNGGVSPSFTTKGRAKAIWFTYRVTASSTDAYTFTNVNPVTGEINNDGLYRYLFNGTYDLQSARSFVVTDNSVSLNNPLSSSQATKAILSYTYE